MAKKFLSLCLLWLAILPLTALAYQNPGTPSGFVNDFAGILTDQQKNELESQLTNFEQQTGNEISVATIPSLDGDTIENFAVRLFADWGIGKKNKDNGLLILVAPNEREVRIEVGYGLEGDITDAQSYWIIQNTILPAFRNNDYYSGISGAVHTITDALAKGSNIPSATSDTSPNLPAGEWLAFVLFIPLWLASILGRSKSWWAGGVLGGIIGVIIGFIKGFVIAGIVSIGILVPLGLLFDFIVSRSYKRARASGVYPWWIGGRGGSGGGGFGGFGGGRSGGGGASGRW